MQENGDMAQQADRGRPPGRMRVALYSHDAQGLGHVRRNLAIAGSLADSELAPDILLLSGTPYARAFDLPPRTDCLTLPALQKSLDGSYSGRLDGSVLLRVRAEAIAGALDAFDPDLLIVDKLPRGAFNELQPALNFSLAPGDPAWSKLIGLRVAWLAWDSKEFDFAPAVTIPLLFVDDPTIGVNIDLFGRYVLSEGWFLFFGQNALNVAVAPGFGLEINVGGGAGYQINGKTALLFGIEPLTLILVPPGGGDPAVTGIWETFNVFATIQYSPAREWDIGLTLSPTYLVPLETFVFGANAYARFRF